VIAAVLLDVGGVFVTPDHALIGPVVEAAGGNATPELLDRAHYAGIAAVDDSLVSGEGGLDWERYRRAVAETAEVPVDRLQQAVDELGVVMNGSGVWRRIMPGSVEGLAELAATGVGLAVVSNSDGSVEHQLMTAGICQVGEGAGVQVAIVVDSAAVGVEKPDPRIFAFALDALGVPGERAVHVGDTVFADVAGARAAGVRPLHLDPYGHCSGDGGPESGPDHDHVRSLAEVAALVRAESGPPHP
jgi:putative hydrolase of the HAD superfamily